MLLPALKYFKNSKQSWTSLFARIQKIFHSLLRFARCFALPPHSIRQQTDGFRKGPEPFVGFGVFVF